jgi:hypothetical protein
MEMELIDKPEIFEPALLRRGVYLPQLQHYQNYFGSGSIKVVGFKDLVDNVPATMNSICTFLNADTIDWSKVVTRPQNQRYYPEVLSDCDRAFLEDYYKEPNQALYDVYGKFNW